MKNGVRFGDFSRPLATGLILFLALLTACRSPKKGSGRDGYNELIRSQQQALAVQQLQQPTVFFHGAVARPMVPWREDLTLAAGLLEAGYREKLSPSSINVIRQGRVYSINVRRLLRGVENPLLEPGDVVELMH